MQISGHNRNAMCLRSLSHLPKLSIHMHTHYIVYICIRIYIYTHAHGRTFKHAHIYIYIYLHIEMHALCACAFVDVRVCIYFPWFHDMTDPGFTTVPAPSGLLDGKAFFMRPAHSHQARGCGQPSHHQSSLSLSHDITTRKPSSTLSTSLNHHWSAWWF